MYNIQDMEATEVDKDRWMGKQDGVVHAHSALLLSHKTMTSYHIQQQGSGDITVSGVRQRKTSIIWYHLVVKSNSGYKWTSLPNRNSPTHSKAPYGHQKGKVVGDEKWEGVDEHIHTTVYK